MPPVEWLTAAAILAAEAILAAAGVHAVAASAVALLAPGLALVPLLPGPTRWRRPAALCAAPVLGLATVAAALITVSAAGVRLDATVVRIVLAGIVLACIATWPLAWRLDREREREPAGVSLLEAAGLAAAVAASVFLSLRVMGDTPVPGNDWAKYVLYADEIRRHGALLIDNPFWMLGQPFREDPGTPALYGALLLLTGAPAAVLAQGIVVFSVLQVLAVFAFVRSFWSAGTAVVAAALVAVVPASQDILGWHGLANLAALGLLALLLAYLSTLATDGLDRPAVVGLALVLVGLAATHRLSAIVGGTVLVVVVVAARVAGVRSAPRDGVRTVVLALVLGAGVVVDLVTRQRTFGGTLGYTDYAGTRVLLGPALKDLSIVLVAGAAVGVVALLLLRPRRLRALWPAVAFTAVCVLLAYAWVVHLPLAYSRMVYFLPLALAPLLAVGLTALRPRWIAAMLAAAGLAVIVSSSYGQAARVRDSYAFASASSLRGLDALSARLRPGEVVVTDRCWSFLATWLLHTRTLPALLPQDIQPKAELPFATMGREILDGTPEGLARARRLGVRYLLVDPTCRDAAGRRMLPPAVGEPVFASRRLAILRLPRVPSPAGVR